MSAALRRHLHTPAGLIGQIFAILLLAMILEFGVSTVLYERASQFSVRDDEARRLAEHLVIARKLLDEQVPAARPLLARELTTSRYEIEWAPALAPPPPLAPSLDRMYRQVIGWEPDLAHADLRLNLASPGRNAVTAGGVTLADRSWMRFHTRQPIHQANLSSERIILAMIPAGALLLMGGLFIRRTLLPLRRLALAADAVGSGSDRDEAVPEAGPSEVRRVIGAFNRMHARIYQLIADRTQALAAVGHDLRTPLARLRMRADAISDEALRDAVEADVLEMDAMVASLLAYLGGEGESEPRVAIDLAVLCETVCDDVSDRGREAVYTGPDHLELSVRPVTLKRAIVNLVENALHYGERVFLTLLRDGSSVVIRIEDDGPGIPAASLARVLEPFVRLDTARARDTIGLGLGLSIVARVVAEHEGTLSLSNRPEGGLRAEIALPAVS
ncbi:MULTISPECIES: ATP-binding protein [unclassified Sphingomonas]|uniref:ATP-binding protein n=1 Tax=unclassified Sphingomonas TaxID=196159 RepID=UPI0019CFAEE8|nr:ATP-binding protein [Sphingomonas sp. AAP5]